MSAYMASASASRAGCPALRKHLRQAVGKGMEVGWKSMYCRVGRRPRRKSVRRRRSGKVYSQMMAGIDGVGGVVMSGWLMSR